MSEAENESKRDIRPEHIDRLSWQDEMVILALADKGGKATSRELREDLTPILGDEDFAPKLSYRLNKLSDVGNCNAGLVEKKKSEKTAQNGEHLNKAVLTDEARQWLYDYEWYNTLSEKRRNLEELSEERRLQVVQQELKKLSAEIEEFRRVAKDSEAFEECLEDAEVVSIRESMDRLSGKIGHLDRRLREIESPSGDETVDGYKRLDTRMNEVEENFEDVEDNMVDFAERWTETLEVMREDLNEVRREVKSIQGEESRQGTISDLWYLAVLNNVMLTDDTFGVGLDVTEFSVSGSDYARLSRHVYSEIEG